MKREQANEELIFWATELVQAAEELATGVKDQKVISTLIANNSALSQVLYDLHNNFQE